MLFVETKLPLESFIIYLVTPSGVDYSLTGIFTLAAAPVQENKQPRGKQLKRITPIS
jgi:hypothetical protein